MKRFILALFILILAVRAAVAQSSASYSVTPSSTTYSPAGGQITFNVAMSYPAGAVPSLAVKPPSSAWVYAGESGANIPPVRSDPGDTTDPSTPTSTFNFAYLTAPSGSASFSFVLSYPAGLTGNQVISIFADYRLSGSYNVVQVPAITLSAQGGGNSPAPVISSSTTAGATVGTAFNYQITASNSPSSYAASNLPAGLSIDTTSGLISGTPTTAGSFNVSLTATNSGGTSAAVTLVLTVGTGATSSPYSVTPSSTTYSPAGGQITFNVAMSYPAGAVPSLAVKPPSGAWVYAGESGANIPPVKSDPGDTTDPSTPTSTFNFAYLTAPSGSASFSFVLSYPAGLTGNQVISIFADYRLSGSYNVVQVPAITLRAPPVISSSTTAGATVGTAFNYQITASNSPTSYAATGLPAWATVSSSGLISGTPTAAGTLNLSLTATNGAGQSSPAALTLTVGKGTPDDYDAADGEWNYLRPDAGVIGADRWRGEHAGRVCVHDAERGAQRGHG